MKPRHELSTRQWWKRSRRELAKMPRGRRRWILTPRYSWADIFSA